MENNKNLEQIDLNKLEGVSGGGRPLKDLCEQRIRNVDATCRTCPELIKQLDVENGRIRCSCHKAWGWFYAEEPENIYDNNGNKIN